MPYITSMERLAEARGKADAFVVQLTKLCGPLPEAHEERIRGPNLDELQKLGGDLLDFDSLTDLQRWLDEHANSVREPQPPM